MEPGSRRATAGVLSVAAVLLPAVGIAYLGAVSYRDDRGIVAAKLDEQFRAAQKVAAALEREVVTTLAATAAVLAPERPHAEALARLRADHVLAARPFHLGRDGRLLLPAPEPLRSDREDAAEPDFLKRVPSTCPERGFDSCIRAIRAARRRAGQLERARRRELGACVAAGAAGCAPDPRDVDAAQRAYTSLARFDDTGPDALLGLARLARQRGDRASALAHYRALGQRFGMRRDRDRISYALIADLGAAEVSPDPAAALALYGRLIARTYAAPSATLALVADVLTERLAQAPLTAQQRRSFADLGQRLDAARIEARFAAMLATEVDEIARTAVARARGRQALTAPERTLVYRREADGTVVGIDVDLSLLERVATKADIDLDALGPGVRIVVERLGDTRARTGGNRSLATAGFGPVLPHLSLALVNDRSMPDPLDDIVEARGLRHLAITGCLVAVLVVGLVATIRGAARERELARLKSDFVSTVSHELKTPLTSIRMFSEMLQQGVAGDDKAREAHYQEIIVKESQRLALLIANLLDYSRIERGTRRYDRQPELAADIARDAVETFQRVRDRDRAPVQLEVRDPEAEILVEREVVVQSIVNLLSNADKYGQAPISVTVYEASGDRVTVSVRDRGPGLPAGEQQRVFHEFYRAPAAYEAQVEGTGLGLALVKRHVEAQGGTVTLDSREGQGATFSIGFPRC